MKSILTIVLFCLLLSIKGLAQSSAKPVITDYAYHPPSADKPSWQRLNLWLSASWLKMTMAKSTHDTCLSLVSRSLGLSLFPVAAEGIDDPSLLSRSQWFDEKNPGKGADLLLKFSGKKRLEQIVLLGAYYAFQSSGTQHNKDSAEYYLQKAINESKAANEKALGRVALCLLSKTYMQYRDTVKGSNAFMQLVKECESAGDKNTLARACFFRGLYFLLPKGSVVTPSLIIGVFTARIGYLKKAKEIYHSLNNTEGEIYAAMNAGYLEGYLNNFDDAYSSFLDALQLQHSIGYPYTHYTTDNIAMIGVTRGEFGEPLKYSQESVRTAEASRDSVGWPTFYGRLAEVYSSEDGREEEVLKWFLKAKDRYMLTNSDNLYPTLINIVSVMNEMPGREKEAFDLAMAVVKHNPPTDSMSLFFQDLSLMSVYMGVKQYGMAERYAFAADSIQKLSRYKTINSDYSKSLIQLLLSDLYFEKGQYRKAKEYYETYLADNIRVRDIASDKHVYFRMLTIDSIFKDPVSAVAHYKKYTALLDSNFKISKIRQGEELQVMYQTKEKENEISMLNEKSKLETANLKQATFTRNVTIGGIIIALFIAGLLYRQSRLRKKNNLLVTSKNQQLQHLLTEKEWLLKEIHHRVKNNLQVVMSLLNSQSAFIDNEPALTAIHDSQHRVHAMSLIHQKLYSTDNVSSIDMSVYIRELATYLRDSFDTGQRVRFEFDIQPIEMDVSQAVPLGLILNEAITNSIKYAFPDGRRGVISISLSNTSYDKYLLTITDNGVGMHPDLMNEKTGSLGMSLMKGLSEDLDGDFSIENNDGTIIKISFIYEANSHKHSALSGATFN